MSEDRRVFEGIPVMAIPKTLLDLAASDPFFLSRALDNAERRGLLDVGAIDALLTRSVGFRGTRRLRRAVEPFRIPAFTRSGVERRFLALVRDAGLPLPAMNHFVAGYELDARTGPPSASRSNSTPTSTTADALPSSKTVFARRRSSWRASRSPGSPEDASSANPTS